MSEYPAMSTWAVISFFRTKEELNKIVESVFNVKENCEMVVFHRGDLTGQMYGMSYNGLDEAAKLLVEFEKKLAELEKAKLELKEYFPAIDYERMTEFTSFDHERKLITGWYEEIKEFFNLSHKYYDQYPAPKPIKTNSVQGLVNLAAYAALAYTVFHFFFG